MGWREDMRQVRALLRPERGRYAMSLSALAVVNLADAIGPVFMGLAVDLTRATLTNTPAKTPPALALVGVDAAKLSITAAVIAYLVAHALGNLARYPMLMESAVPSHRIGQTIRRRTTDHLLRLPQAFYDRARTGDLMSLATSDILAVRMMLGPGVLVGVDAIMLLVFVLSVMFLMSWQLAIVAMIPLPLIVLVTNKLSHVEYVRFEDAQEDLAHLTERVRESYAGIRIIQGYAREGFDDARFERASWQHYLKNMALVRVRSVFDPTLDLMVGLSRVLVFGVGGVMVVRDALSLGTFVAFLFMVGYLSGPMIGFGWSVSLFQRGRASLHRLERLWAVPPLITDAPDAVVADGPGALEVRRLSFSYENPVMDAAVSEGVETRAKAAAGADAEEDLAPVPTRAQALQEVSFRLEAGQTLGVVGAVGSGKSTLARLLTRLYEAPAGTIFLDDQDIQHVTLESLRRQVVLAPQDTFLFGTTVSRNILMAGEQGDDPTRTARMACLHDELEALSEGYDTLLGERGINLSGGQRQRLAIARAIAADPRVLILDDCLSAVDAKTEEAILQQLRQVFEGRTGVIISHRVRAVQRCDHIIVLDEGRVIERGDHASLIATGGKYAHIAAEQAASPASKTERSS